MPNTHAQRAKSISERFWEKVDKTGGPNACWPWKAYGRRYGYFSTGSRTDGTRTLVLAHRMAYELQRGPIGKKEIDHLCRNTLCVNPSHLEPVTHRVNMRRGAWGSRTHCPSGHKYTRSNTATYVRLDGSRNRICITCRREAYRRRIADPAHREMVNARARKNYDKRKAMK
jgi:hypothetical protein